MSKVPREAQSDGDSGRPEIGGPNLLLLYALLALVLVGALAVAAMIVWPFYRRH